MMRGVAAALLSIAVAAVPAAARPFDAIDAVVDRLQATGEFSGAIVVRRGGEVLYERAAGWANPERGLAFSVTTPTDSASLAKPFTALLALMLAREGRVDLDGPVVRYVPEYPHGETRVRHLLQHTAGLPDYDAFGALFKSGQPVTTSAMLRELADRRTPPRFAPGTRFEYCNLCLDTLALAIERATGMNFDAVLRERVWAPAGIEHALLRPARLDALPASRAVGHRWREGTYQPHDAEDFEAFHGASNLFASVRDFARFGAAFAEGAAWLGAAAEDAVQRVHLRDGAATGLALGNWYCAAGARRCYYTGHHRGFYNLLYWNSERRIAIAWVSNSTVLSAQRARFERALVAAAEGLPAPPDPAATVPLDDEKLRALAGEHVIEGAGRVRFAFDGSRATLRSAEGVEYSLFRVSSRSFYAPGVDALIGSTDDGRLVWSSVFVNAVAPPAPR
jgi:CubicO group peptidase (beta-lactamase class C family)